ncbi:MAG TPA: hypothetical protein VJV79_12350 [Polyangiaceae bacterium]|nr:hypothetical protein [Polyangiaceae bacterium]
MALFAAAWLCARPVQANGAFPAVSQLVADPSDQAHLVLRSNFGLLITHDHGMSWDLVCEAGVGYENLEPAIAVLGDGTTIAALPNGIAHGTTECAFGLASGINAYVADVARVPSTAARAVAVSVEIEAGVSQVWRSLDGARSWQPWGTALRGLNATTLDVAGDESTLYVSGISQSGTVKGVLARSLDGGQTWSRTEVPGANKLSAPYIAAIDAIDADTLYVRLSGSSGKLLVSHDGGQHWSGVLQFTGPLDGFALSPDGRYALASGRLDGVWRASTSNLAFERVSCIKLRCLSWTNAGLFACADEFQAGFLVGESADLGSSFEPRLHLSCVRGPLACESDSPVARACDASWPALSEVLGSDCTNAVFTPRTDCSNGGNSGTGPGASAGAATSGERSTAGLRPGAGCSLSTPADPRCLGLSALLALLCAMARRRAGRE